MSANTVIVGESPTCHLLTGGASALAPVICLRGQVESTDVVMAAAENDHRLLGGPQPERENLMCHASPKELYCRNVSNVKCTELKKQQYNIKFAC